MAIECVIRTEADVYIAVCRARALARAASVVVRTQIEITVLELARNLLAHAQQGRIVLTSIQQHAITGILVESIDEGPGIPDVDAALCDGYSTLGTMGSGLPSVRRLTDEFAVDSGPGLGTYIRAVKWLSCNNESR